jgi:hypothetical protein
LSLNSSVVFHVNSFLLGDGDWVNGYIQVV